MKLPKAYEPGNYESDVYALWEKSGAFKPKPDHSKGVFSIVAPPPNANAGLHIGYGLVIALEDIAARYNRMLGKSTLFVPGADHAGFETQSVYEKQLAKEGKSRFDFGRDELYKKIWDFVAKNRGNYEKEFRALGASFDWDYFTFTLDPKVIKQAYSTFKKMWDKKLIYRGERLVNFCTFHGTAFADIEVEYKETKGHLWYIKYPLTDGSGEVVVATTRPETMLGDTAVAVNPSDKRYGHLVGKTVRLPLTNREIPVLADEMVDSEFGTGAVKITPGHDPNDFEVARRHDLPMLTVISYEGKMTHEVPEPYRNLEVKAARKKVVEDLKQQGYLDKVEDHTNSVGHCYKCGTVIQPLLKEQWFVDMQPLAKPAIKALEDKQMKFYPDSKRLQLIHYLEGLHDWNISRQIAWGIPIPAFQSLDDPEQWIFDERVGEEEITVDGKAYRRDPDVFDTWFSSSSWPYVTLNYPEGQGAKEFYPLSLMETGGEILYPWVSRMLMLGLYETGQVPFKTVYIHGYVMAHDGTKMSKSIGNTVDLTEVINKYGSDALRMGIIAGRVPAVNRGYDQRKIEEARNFCNKLWNVARYVEANFDGGRDEIRNSQPRNSADQWILNMLSISADKISQDLDNYNFGEAYDKLYHFVWNDFADWYVEASKVEPNAPLLAYVLDQTIKIAHAFAPFVTEAIWQAFAWKDEVLAIQSWPEIKKFDSTEANKFEGIKSIVTEVRWLKAISGAKVDTLYHQPAPDMTASAGLIAKLAGLKEIKELPADYSGGVKLSSVRLDCRLDIDPVAVKDNLAAKLKETKAEENMLRGRLEKPEYKEKAPKELIEQTEKALAQAVNQVSRLEQILENI